jgi:hypothetical protein
VTIWPFEAQALQLGEQTLHRHLPLDVLHQHEAHDPGAKVAGHLGRQRCDDLLACHPALTAEPDGARIRSCTVKGSKPRAQGGLDDQGSLLSHRRGAPATLPVAPLPARLLGPGSFVRFRRLVHAARRQLWLLRQSLQPGVLRAQLPDLFLQGRHPNQQLNHQLLQLVEGEGVQVWKRRYGHAVSQPHGRLLREALTSPQHTRRRGN